MPGAYYNEHDAKAAAWLRELIAQGHIAPGEVDERSIADVAPDDLRGFTQCHFFAGIGVWSHALRGAGWSDADPVWTGSCPCQPFSASGKRGGTDDHRHLWPAWFRLIRECRPNVCFGEQVASPDGLAWFDFVCAGLEGAGYAVGACDTCAAGVGAPHIRQRLYFVAHDDSAGRGEFGGLRLRGPEVHDPDRCGANGGLGDAGSTERWPEAFGRADADQNGRQRRQDPSSAREHGATGIVGDADRPNESAERIQRSGQFGRPAEDAGTGATAGFWGDADWLPCRDSKARPVEPGSFPLVTGAPARVVRLRGYGNALCAPQAQAFIEAYLDIRGG